jgi:hypothetical protein
VRASEPVTTTTTQRPVEPPSDAKPAGSDVDPTGGVKPRRPIDPNNPYGGAP